MVTIFCQFQCNFADVWGPKTNMEFVTLAKSDDASPFPKLLVIKPERVVHSQKSHGEKISHPLRYNSLQNCRSQWSSGNCSVRGPRFKSHCGQLQVFHKTTTYIAMGIGCTHLLLWSTSLLPSMGW